MVEEVTIGERLLIFRRRDGISQAEAAQQHGVSRNMYGEMERAESEPCIIVELSVPEKCLIMRRRRGYTQQECADRLGVTRFWYNQMEKGSAPVAELAKFWGIEA